MEFIETTAFSRRADALLEPGQLQALEMALAGQPELRAVVPGLGGIRKLRWPARQRGRRGGLRIMYYWAPSRRLVLLLFVFSKSERADLSAAQRRVLRDVVRRELE